MRPDRPPSPDAINLGACQPLRPDPVADHIILMAAGDTTVGSRPIRKLISVPLNHSKSCSGVHDHHQR
jgi:hypothetical protein